MGQFIGSVGNGHKQAGGARDSGCRTRRPLFPTKANQTAAPITVRGGPGSGGIKS